jgi:hypothetical protein
MAAIEDNIQVAVPTQKLLEMSAPEGCKLVEADREEELCICVQKLDLTENPPRLLENPSATQKNRGTGAGGAQTTLNGRGFETITDVEDLLLERGFKKRQLSSSKRGYVLEKSSDECELMYVSQSGLKLLAKSRYGIEALRHPDGAYIIEYKNGRRVLKILEKKTQSVDGSVDIKLWAGHSMRREYEKSWPEFEVEYAFCVNVFFQKKFEDTTNNRKYAILREMLEEDGIELFFGDMADYFQKLDIWMQK